MIYDFSLILFLRLHGLLVLLPWSTTPKNYSQSSTTELRTRVLPQELDKTKLHFCCLLRKEKCNFVLFSSWGGSPVEHARIQIQCFFKKNATFCFIHLLKWYTIGTKPWSMQHLEKITSNIFIKGCPPV